jgi:NADH-quinone oxidoreductase subunit L
MNSPLPDFAEHPGLYFVAATLVPLASFVLILLAAFMRAALRPYRETAARPVYELFGGDVGGSTAAWVATAAIAIAFGLSLTGFVQFIRQQGEFEAPRLEHEKEVQRLKDEMKELTAASDHEKREELHEKIEQHEEQVKHVEERWERTHAAMWRGSFDWIRIHPGGISDPEHATALRLGYGIDTLSALMFVMVTFIATLIHLFSIGYMQEELQPTVEDHQVPTEVDPLHAAEAAHHGHDAHSYLKRRGRFGRFFMYLSLFCFSMLNLVLADNLFQVFLSWELVGVCSYLLIGFYYERRSASNAANKAFITNRIGDAGFILGLLILWTYVGSFNFEDVFARVRSPLRDVGGPVPVGGQLVRGDFTEPGLTGVRASKAGKAAGAAHTLEVTPGGSELLLFPRERGEKYSGVGEKRDSRVAVYDAPAPTEHGSMPYWLLVAAGLGIFLGCVGKSAQFPLQVWLPDAMEGPTPVSALIHAATMVAAGVYLVGRCYPLFTPEALLVIAYVGGITLFVAATIAIVMTDIKKVLAYSTVSQLGYMMLALGVGGWVAGLFHLLTHAFFKALLFLCSGSVIYGCHHEQDMLKMGGLFPRMKITAICMLVGTLAIAGIPLFTGWYSKDAILAQAFGFVSVHPNHLLLFLLPLVTAGITAFYMARMWLLTFTGTPRDHHVYEHAHESPALMTGPLVVLAVCSICVAWGWPLWDANASALEHAIHHAQPTAVLADFGNVLDDDEAWEYAKVENANVRLVAHQWHHLPGALALGLVVIALVFAGLIYYYRVLDPAEAREQFPALHAFLTDKWRFDWLYSVVLVRPVLVVAHWFKAFDLYVIDGIINGLARLTVWVSKWDGRFDNGIVDGLVNLVGNVTYDVGARLRNVQTGALRSYVLFLVVAAVCIVVVLSYLVRMAVAG